MDTLNPAGSNELRKVDVKVWSNAKCADSQHYGPTSSKITDSQICAATPEEGKDSCSVRVVPPIQSIADKAKALIDLNFCQENWSWELEPTIYWIGCSRNLTVPHPRLIIFCHNAG